MVPPLKNVKQHIEEEKKGFINRRIAYTQMLTHTFSSLELLLYKRGDKPSEIGKSKRSSTYKSTFRVSGRF